jgi:hypothetical protein
VRVVACVVGVAVAWSAAGALNKLLKNEKAHWQSRVPCCTKIVDLRLPAALLSIGDNAFKGCTGIVALHLPDTLQSIGESAFSGCTGIDDLQLPDTLQSIGDGAFNGCTGIVELQLPDTLQSIGNDAFSDCTGLVHLHLPPTLQSIGEGDEIMYDDADEPTYENGMEGKGAFDGCSSLAHVLAPGSLVRGEMADPTKVFECCPVLVTGLTPLSSIRLLRRTLWHPTMHSWCTQNQRMCVLAVLVAELR